MANLTLRPAVTKYLTRRIRYGVCLKVKWVGLFIVIQERWTALHYAADRGHVEVLHLLLMVEHCNVIATNKVSAKIVQCFFYIIHMDLIY